MKSNKNLIYVLRILLRWWKLIIAVTLIAAAGSIAISLLLPNYYKSTAVFYPKNLNIFDSNYLFGEGGNDKIQSIFGDNQDVNRILSIGKSSALKNGIINDFQLWNHYDIDSSRSQWRYKLTQKFESNFKLLKTQYDNVELSVWDKDPKLASEIANSYVRKIGAEYAQVVKERNANNLNSVQDRVDELQAEINQVTDSLESFRDTAHIQFKTLQRLQTNLIEDYNKWNSLLMQYKAGSDYDFDGLYMVEKAYPAERKDKPVRWLIVVSSTLAAFILSILAVLLIEQYRSIKDELQEDE